MPSLPDPVRKGASVAAAVLESTAGVLRAVAGDEEPGAAATATAPVAAFEPDPKAAGKVRAREG